MNRTTLLTIASGLLATCIIGVAAQGCGDDSSATNTGDSGNNNNPDTSIPTGDTGTGNDSGTTIPAVPTLGAQIDRMGRPAINTALNHAFDPNDTTKGAAKDAYNQDSNVAGWKAAYTTELSSNLAILDGLEGPSLAHPGTGCGNALFSTGDAAGPASVTYGALGSVAADDRLWIKTDAVATAPATNPCTTYLAVEADATGFLKNGDCGGRGLAYDVIDITYSAVSIGAVSGVGDGIDADPVKTSGTGTSTPGGALAFPYLAPPVQ